MFTFCFGKISVTVVESAMKRSNYQLGIAVTSEISMNTTVMYINSKNALCRMQHENAHFHLKG